MNFYWINFLKLIEWTENRDGYIGESESNWHDRSSSGGAVEYQFSAAVDRPLPAEGHSRPMGLDQQTATGQRAKSSRSLQVCHTQHHFHLQFFFIFSIAHSNFFKIWFLCQLFGKILVLKSIIWFPESTFWLKGQLFGF